jgi:predicted O-methyltransferase YrrM
MKIKKILKSKFVLGAVDIFLLPFSFLSVLLLKPSAKYIRYMPINNRLFSRMGLLPVLDHYYQPLINPQKHLKNPLNTDRYLPGININTEEQLRLLSEFDYNKEFEIFSITKQDSLTYYFNNGSFESGDAEFLYNIIRLKKPKRFIEIGSGFSTLIANSAIKKNNNNCKHTCIEPYEVEWIERLGIEVIRKKLEDIDCKMFDLLEKDDILFIDSSHIIRPQGDVLLEYLQILPLLKPGVIIHIHDIFTPKDYLEDFVFKYRYLWNEQYLLEALLTNTESFKIIGAVNYLKNNYFDNLASKCPILKTQSYREPGSFWITKL